MVKKNLGLDVNINDKMTKLNQKYTIREIYKMMFQQSHFEFTKMDLLFYALFCFWFMD